MRKLLCIGTLFLAAFSHAAVYTSTATLWYIHVLGSSNNAGGYDPSIPSAGTNLADADSSSMTWTDLVAPVASTNIITSVTGGFSPAMVGNSIQLTTAAATNFQQGYYFITSVQTSNALTVDRAASTATGAALLGKGVMGGAWKDLTNIVLTFSGTGFPVPQIPAPIQPQQTLMIKGSGSLDGSTTDYAWTNSFNTVPSGSLLLGPIHMTGYNGRPYITHAGILFNNLTYWTVSHTKIVDAGGGSRNSWTGATFTGSFYDNIVDSNGLGDVCAVNGASSAISDIYNNQIRNTGTKTAGTASRGLVCIPGYANLIHGNFIYGGRTDGILVGATSMGSIWGNIISSNTGSGIEVLTLVSYGGVIHNNTIDSNNADGIRYDSLGAPNTYAAFNNIITNSGGFGLNMNFATIPNSYQDALIDFNNYFGNASGSYGNTTASPHDLALNPNYTAANTSASSDWTPQNSSLNASFPQSWLNSATLNYLYMGSVQPLGTGGGASTHGSSYIQ